ncbi:MAG: crossover junction endodeoxyribonuclease RuvC [Chloroflexi bacterium]|nr:crossover junction endodeoxyribonuclease RuvC [Chloroflexota bacterium]
MRILGVDPGTFKMGVGVVDSERGELSLVYAGVLTPAKGDPLSARLHYIYEQLIQLIHEWTPSAVAIEEPFIARNVKAAMAVGQAQGVAMVAAAHHSLTAYGYSPRAVKQSVTDYGGSSKSQVQDMISVLLGLPGESRQPSDAADALAVAICHINASHVSQLIIRE